MQKVEHPWIILVNFTSTVVPQKTVQAGQRFLIVAFGIAVDDVQPLSSMCVEKMQAVGTAGNRQQVWLGGRSRDHLAGKRQRQQQKKTAQTSWRPRQSKRLPKNGLATIGSPCSIIPAAAAPYRLRLVCPPIHFLNKPSLLAAMRRTPPDHATRAVQRRYAPGRSPLFGAGMIAFFPRYRRCCGPHQ